MVDSSDLQNNILDWKHDSGLVGNAVETSISDITPIDWIYGGIINDKTSIFSNIPYRERVETVVILAPTEYETDSFTAFTYNHFNEIPLATDLIKKIADTNNVKNLGEVGEKSYWQNGILSEINKQFPNAELIPISVSETADEWKMQSLAYILKTTLPEKSIVLAVADLGIENENALIKNYQQQFINSSVLYPAQDRFANLTEKPAPQLQVLNQYLTYKQAKKAIVADSNQVLYQLGQTSYNPSAQIPVFLVSFGDMMLGRYVQTLMSRTNDDYPFSFMDESYMKMNDLLLANLEGPIAKNAIQTSKTIAFRFLPSVVPLIKKHHFDILSLANNHALDMGTQGYDDSRELLTAAGILNFGDPRHITDESITKIIKNGQKIAFLGLEEVVYDIDDDKTIETIKQLTQEGYKVIVMPHWGIEYVHKPNKRQQDLAHKMIDAGAFMVIAHHPHVVQAYETYKGHPIFYSLGNFIFDQYWSQDTQIGLTVALKFTDDQIEINFLPIHIDYSRPRLMNEDDRKDFMEEFVTYGEYTPEEREEILTGNLTVFPQSL